MPAGQQPLYDAAIIGGGPAGLNAAVVLGRCRRRVALFDHGKPRNYAARAVNCYLAADRLTPNELRHVGRKQATAYGVELIDEEVLQARCLSLADERPGFELHTERRIVQAKMLMLATGVVDLLPEIDGIQDLYGRSVHHCPYCDGWEHRDQRLGALGDEHPR